MKSGKPKARHRRTSSNKRYFATAKMIATFSLWFAKSLLRSVCSVQMIVQQSFSLSLDYIYQMRIYACTHPPLHARVQHSACCTLLGRGTWGVCFNILEGRAWRRDEVDDGRTRHGNQGPLFNSQTVLPPHSHDTTTVAKEVG